MDQDVDDRMDDIPDIEIPCPSQIPDSQNTQSEHEISHTFEGAPEMVKQSDSSFPIESPIYFYNFHSLYVFFFIYSLLIGSKN